MLPAAVRRADPRTSCVRAAGDRRPSETAGRARHPCGDGRRAPARNSTAARLASATSRDLDLATRQVEYRVEKHALRVRLHPEQPLDHEPNAPLRPLVLLHRRNPNPAEPRLEDPDAL